ncbi:MAG: helix-turn-helix transcriptional regulator [Anaerolineae bacterium]|nr:helix-turn-helix transcriptional regulator [Anaerolineae bacterium]
MDFSNISARLRKQRDEQTEMPATADFEESYRVRAHMVGVLLRDARISAQRSAEDCARLLHVEPEMVEMWEYGDETPALPQLEILAYYLDVPVSHFWSATTLQSEKAERTHAQSEYLALRDRMIGVLLRQARENAEMSLEALGELSGLSAEAIARYELGEQSLPLNVLTVLANGVNKNLSYFLESSSHIGEWLALREAANRMAELPDELRRFVTNPLNRGFIEIAMMFSQMPTDKLRKIGENFLDITM